MKTSQPEKENKFDFQKVKQHVDTLTTIKDKILYLIEIKTDFNQYKFDLLKTGSDFYTIPPFDPNFELKCELEIKKLNELLKFEAQTTTPNSEPVFKLSEKKGAKTDLIRVLSALYEIRLIEKTNGQLPTKQEFMEKMGEYLGVDLSNYSASLSQALNNQSLETNLQVFEDMKNIISKAHNDKLNKEK